MLLDYHTINLGRSFAVALPKTTAKKRSKTDEKDAPVDLLREILSEVQKLNRNVESLAERLVQRNVSEAARARDYDEELEEYE